MTRARSSSIGGAAGWGRARTIGIIVFGLALALTGMACYDPLIEDGHLPCSRDPDPGACPRGFLCATPCNFCFHIGFQPHGMECSSPVITGDEGGSGDAGSGGARAGGAGGGGGPTGAGGGGVVGGGGSGAGAGGGAGAGSGAGGHGGAMVGGSGGTLGGAGMNGTAGATGMGGHAGAGGATNSVGGQTGAGGLTGAAGAVGAGGKVGGTGGAAPGLGGATGSGGTPGLGLGSACTVGTQCASSFCADKVCCNSGCTGQCQACDITPGICSPVASGQPHGARGACSGTGVCGAQCALASATTAACAFAARTVNCGAQTCTGSTLTAPRLCDGAGVCAAGASSPCPLGLNCNAQSACLASCATNTDCTSAVPFCNLGTHQCTTARPVGSACNIDGDCQNGLCVDKICCNDPCTSSCMACDVAGNQGTCTMVPAGQQPHGARAACGGAATCQGSCSGASPACQFPGAETACVCPGVIPTTGSCNMAGGCLLLGLLCL